MKRQAIWGAVILALVVATFFLLIRCGYIHRGLGPEKNEEWEQPGETNTNWI